MGTNPTDGGVRPSFESIAFEHMDAIYRTALRMTRDAKDAEDLAQETYLRAFRHYDQFEAGTNFKAWIFTILTNIFINNYRKKSRQPPTVDFAQVEAVYQDLEKEPKYLSLRQLDQIQDRLSDEVKESLDRLPEEYRLVFLLSVFEDLSYREIAQIVGCPIGTVMSRLFRARQQLQKELSDFARSEGMLKQEPQGERDAVS